MNKRKLMKRGFLTAFALTGLLAMMGGTSSADAATVVQSPSSESGQIRTSGYGNNPWENYMIIRKDGKPVFCVDPTTAVINGGYTSEEVGDVVYINGDYWNGTITAEQLREMELIAYYGYYSNPTDARYTFTQGMIWSVIGFEPQSFSGTLSMDEYNSFYYEVKAQVDGYRKTPSWNGEAHELLIGQSVTLVDSNNVIQNLAVPTSQNGYDLSVSGNELTITATEDSEDGDLFFKQNSSDYVGTSLIWRKPGSQTLAELFIKDPQNGLVEVTTIKTKGSHALRKIDFTGNPLSGVEFKLVKVEADGTEAEQGTFTTDADGYIKLENYEFGHYYFQETKALNGYTPDAKKHSFEIKVGDNITEETTTTVKNLKEPEIHTLAQNLQTGTKDIYEYETIKETAYIENTDLGRKYTVRTYMNDKTTKEERIAVQEKNVVGNGGTLVIDFEYPVLKKTFGHTIVFGEELLDIQGNVIKSHFDWENEKETVYVRMPKIKTTATVSGKKVVTVGEDGQLSDTIQYEDFRPNTEVFVRLEVAKYGTEEVVATYETIAKIDGNGELVVTADTFNTKDLPAGKYVTFETIFEVKDGKPTENIISKERDPKNEDQSFEVTTPEEPKQPELPYTGTQDTTMTILLALLSLTVAFGLVQKKQVN